MCHVKYYCCCTPLRVGCVAIGIVCIIFAITITIFSALKFQLKYEEKEKQGYSDHMLGLSLACFPDIKVVYFLPVTVKITTIAMAVVDIILSCLLVVFSILLICGAVQMNACLLAPWTVFAIGYVVVQAGVVCLDIYLLAKEGEYFAWQVANVVLTILFCGYTFYGMAVVCSYKMYILQLRKEDFAFWMELKRSDESGREGPEPLQYTKD